MALRRDSGSLVTFRVSPPAGWLPGTWQIYSISEMSLTEFVHIAPLFQWRNSKSEIRHFRTVHRFLIAQASTSTLTFAATQ